MCRYICITVCTILVATSAVRADRDWALIKLPDPRLNEVWQLYSYKCTLYELTNHYLIVPVKLETRRSRQRFVSRNYDRPLGYPVPLVTLCPRVLAWYLADDLAVNVSMYHCLCSCVYVDASIFSYVLHGYLTTCCVLKKQLKRFFIWSLCEAE